jgi:hypothetical protein
MLFYEIFLILDSWFLILMAKDLMFVSSQMSYFKPYDSLPDLWYNVNN